MKILLTAALKPEIQPIKQYLKKMDNLNISYLITGVGPTNANRNLSDHLQSNTYDLVINAGTAGSLSEDIRIGDIFFPERYAAKIDNKIQNLQCEYFNNISISDDWKTGELFTSDHGIMTKEQKENVLKIIDSKAVDMETFFLARCCKNMGISFISIKIISDVAENLTIVKFRDHLKMVISLLLEPIQRLLTNLKI